MNVYVYTSIALNYLPKARVLFSTVRKFHPNWKISVTISDREHPVLRKRIAEMPEFDETIWLDELNFTDGFGNALNESEREQWIFKHSVVEICTAVKGASLVRLLSKPDCGAVLYLDPDMVLLDNLDRLIDYLQNGSSILLTPHGVVPEKTKQSVLDNEFGMLRWGVYNLGFLMIKNDTEGNRFAQWWRDRLEFHCYDNTTIGLFTDQSWCDMVPALFEAVKVVRDPQFNVATWNLSHREITGEDISQLYVNGTDKLAIYHFSGFDSGAQLVMLNKYGGHMQILFKLRNWYIEMCETFSDPDIEKMTWSFECYEDGTKITAEQRLLYRQREDLQGAFNRPFSSGPMSYQAWLKAEAEKAYLTDLKKMEKSRLMRIIFKRYRKLRLIVKGDEVYRKKNRG